MINKKGFSLIELIIIIVLIAIISVIAFISFWNQAIKARNSMRMDTASKYAKWVRMYKFENLKYPSEWTNNISLGYYDSDDEGDAWFWKYSANDVMILKNSDFDDTLRNGAIRKYVSRVVLDPASTSSDKINLRYWVDYNWFCLRGSPECTSSTGSLQGTKFEIWTILELEDGTYKNHVVGDLTTNDYTITFN